MEEDKRGGVGGWPAGGNMHDILETCITGINCIRERLINKNCSSPTPPKCLDV